MNNIIQIEVIFAEPVTLTDGQNRRLVAIMDEVCADYNKANPSRVMWTSGFGGRPSGFWSDEPSFDMSVYQIECTERERFEGERQ